MRRISDGRSVGRWVRYGAQARLAVLQGSCTRQDQASLAIPDPALAAAGTQGTLADTDLNGIHGGAQD